MNRITFRLRRIFLATIFLLCASFLAGLSNLKADDDWEAVTSTSTVSEPQRSVPSATAVQKGTQPSSADQSSIVCGERALPASAQVASIVDRINGLWGTEFRAYQTIAFEQPHASSGGCVFYNAAAMATILSGRLVVRDTDVVDPLVWAIFAHEIGHQYHRDTEAVRDSVPTEIKELEADRFAGYTLQKLKIRATDLTPYWNLTGDEFGGPAALHSPNRHGTSAERVAAFKQGWHLAEWNRPENSGSVLAAQDESVAPEDSEAAPK